MKIWKNLLAILFLGLLLIACGGSTADNTPIDNVPIDNTPLAWEGVSGVTLIHFATDGEKVFAAGSAMVVCYNADGTEAWRNAGSPEVISVSAYAGQMYVLRLANGVQGQGVVSVDTYAVSGALVKSTLVSTNAIPLKIAVDSEGVFATFWDGISKVAKLDLAGNLVNDQFIYSLSESFNAIALRGTRLVLAGNESGGSIVTQQYSTSTGVALWSQAAVHTVGFGGIGYAGATTILPDNSVVVAAYQFFATDGHPAFLLKYDSAGLQQGGVLDVASAALGMAVAPNGVIFLATGMGLEKIAVDNSATTINTAPCSSLVYSQGKVITADADGGPAVYDATTGSKLF